MKNGILNLFLAVFATVAAVECAFAVNAKSYIQDGLIFHLDAIANNGVDPDTGADLHVNHTSSPYWRELVGNGAMKRSSQKSVTWSSKYADFSNEIALSNAFPAVLRALRARSLTAEIFLHPKEYKQYGGYFHLGGLSNHRYVTLEMGEDDAKSPSYKGAFHRLQAYDTAWGSNSDILINADTKQYFNKDVHATITVDAVGSHLAFNDDPIVHTNPSSKIFPSTDIVMVGAYQKHYSKTLYYAFRIYNRVLEDWEKKFNRELDKVRFLDANNVVMKVQNLTAPGEIVTHSEAFVASDGSTVTFKNEGVSSPSSTLAVIGYSHYAENGDLIASGSGGEYICTLDKATMLCSRLEWIVETKNLLTISTEGSGSVSLESGLYDAAQDVEIVATPAAGYRFLRWQGDIPEDVNVSNPTLTLPMDCPRSVTAVFFETSQSVRYIALDWIESTGREWIDTGVKVAGMNNVDTRIQPLACGITAPSKTKDNETSYSLYGGGDAVGVNEMKVVSTCVYGTNAYIKTCYSGSQALLPDTGYCWYSVMSNMNIKGSVNGTLSAGPSTHTYLRSNGVVSFKVNNYVYPSGHTEESFVSQNNFYIFNANTPGYETKPCNARLWYFKIYDSVSGDLIRDFVPVKIAETGEVGLYDNVTESFFGNVSGEGEFIAGPMAHSEWRSTDDGLFDYSVEWTISGYNGSEQLANVPVLIRLSEATVSGFSYSHCLENGADIAFSSEENFSNRLPFEIDEWNVNGTSLIWVKLPVLSGKDTKLYMRYGRRTPAKNLPPSEVWSDYLAVWHMNGKGGAQGELDSSPRGNTAVCVLKGVPNVADAKIGKGTRIIPCHYLASKKGLYRYEAIYDNMPQVFTVSYWCKWDSFVKNTAGLEAFDNVVTFGDTTRRYGWGFEWGSKETSYPFYYGKSSYTGKNVSSLSPTWNNSDVTTWIYYTASTDGHNIKVYRNGANLASNTYGAEIGGFDTPVRICGSASKARAIADEVRVSREPLSAARIAADYAMMTNASFATADRIVKLTGFGVSIVGDPTDFAADVISYGANTSVLEGDVIASTAPEFALINNEPDQRAYCLGWDLYRIVDGEEVFVRSSANTSVEGESLTKAIITVEGTMKLVWHWEEQYKISSSIMAPGDTLSECGTVSEAGWVKNGTSFTLNATPSEGYRFLCWASGSGLDTSEKVYSPTVTYTSGDNIPEYKAVFVPNDFDATWLYLPSEARVLRVTGPRWVFNNVSCSGVKISIPVSMSHLTPDSASALDMTGLVKDLDGNSYEFYRFTSSGYTENLLGEESATARSKLITSLVLPESFTTTAGGTFQFLESCVSFNFLGDIGVAIRQFYNAKACKWIRFHYFPPTVGNTSTWTFWGCGAGDYKFRIEYPSFLENAWLYASNVGAKYYYKDVMTDNEKKDALSEYRDVFGRSAPEPNGYAALNFINGENSPQRKAALVSYEAEVKSGKISLGIMDLPYAVAKAETMSPSYGYHEYDTGEPIVITAPRKYTEYDGQPYLCRGYVLSNRPNITNNYVSSFTLPGNVDANIGVTWIWKKYSGVRGMAIIIK
ncbi:MAG: hypothetical protein J6S51_01615 [Kiritimatiellae bacterium]|nr:hypothetical protein [Kiritimatiellia bacterium]